METPSFSAPGLEAAGVLDALVHDKDSGRVILAMFERRPWSGGDRQLWQLQEKLNAYASYALDGELREQHPDLAHLPICLQLRTVHRPSERALHLLEQVRHQLSFMDVSLEIWEIGNEDLPL